MMTNVPPITFGATGFLAPASPLVLAGVQADISAAFGQALNFNLNTPQGQLASSEAALIVNANSIFVYFSNQVDPAFATGRMQDAIGRIYFQERLPAEPTVLQVRCTGLVGAVVPVGALIQDVSGNVYQCTDAATIAAVGNVTTQFEAQVPGPTAVPAADGVSIYQAVPGLDAVAVLSGVVGRDAETRSQFEARRAATVAKNAIGILSAIRGAVLDVSGVLDAYVTENVASSPVVVGGVTLAAKSLYVAAVGGAAADVARAIWSKKAPGCAYNGTTSVTVFDDNSGYSPPFPSYVVSFQRPASLAIYFNVLIINGPSVPADAVTQVQNALLAAFAGSIDGGPPKASIGATLFALQYAPPIIALGSWAQVATLGIGSANDFEALVTAQFSGTVMTVLTVTSGTLAVGQTLVDAFGAIQPGTRIASFGTGSGGVGTYNVTLAHTLGANFTGTGSGTNLTASSVVGKISVGDVVTGTGVPANTTIVSQSSGTPGGAGVYVTSNATTSSGASLKAADVVTAADNTDTSVIVRIDQVPTLNAADIVVSVT
jgi:baseplate J-like protein